MAKLIVIASNHQPKREEKYPHTWLLYMHEKTIEIHRRRVTHNRSFVVDKGAA